ncbi:MAG: Flp family type IVb pilin [Alphaproteobacteria bacterium]|nr:Flp family type IVb pilin [Alphaproteobacteria bacterium]
MSLFRRAVYDVSGSTAIEYALIASLIAVVIVGSVVTLGGSVGALWDRVVAAFTS